MTYETAHLPWPDPAFIMLELFEHRTLAMDGGTYVSSEAWKTIDSLLDLMNTIGWAAVEGEEAR